jgi:hypothetical protein
LYKKNSEIYNITPNTFLAKTDHEVYPQSVIKSLKPLTHQVTPTVCGKSPNVQSNNLTIGKLAISSCDHGL